MAWSVLGWWSRRGGELTLQQLSAPTGNAGRFCPGHAQSSGVRATCSTGSVKSAIPAPRNVGQGLDETRGGSLGRPEVSRMVSWMISTDDGARAPGRRQVSWIRFGV